MVYLRRKIDDYLLNWYKDKNHNPLIIRGARQIGKTESIKNFAYKYYESVIYINFIEEPKYTKIIDGDYTIENIIKNITLIDNTKIFIPKKTIIIFDELQKFPDIATSLKFFKIDGNYDVICSGSLLGISYHEIESNSVGYKSDYEMTSMDFEEFLWAKGYDDEVIKDMLSHMVNLKPFNKLELEIYKALFLEFCIVGGMPRIVNSFIENNDYRNVLQMQSQIILDYKEDVQKYAIGLDKTRILNVFNYIPVQLSKENKKFQISKVSHGARWHDYRGCVEWLEKAGIISVARMINPLELPLKGNYREDYYKIYLNDTGLLISLLDEESQLDLKINKNLGVYKGAIYENIASEALIKQGYDLFYYKKDNSSLELDFILRFKNNIVPLEIKATNSKSKSLRTVIDSDEYPEVKYGIKFGDLNIGYSDDIISFPHFLLFLLRRYFDAIR